MAGRSDNLVDSVLCPMNCSGRQNAKTALQNAPRWAVPLASTGRWAIPFARGVFYHNRVGLGRSESRSRSSGRVRDRRGVRGQNGWLRSPGTVSMSAAEPGALYHRIPEGERIEDPDCAARRGLPPAFLPVSRGTTRHPSVWRSPNRGARGGPPLQPCNRATVQVRRHGDGALQTGREVRCCTVAREFEG